MVECPCCEKPVQAFHKRSHVLPDWMFQDAYSDKHRLIALDLKKESRRIEQSAPYGEYWCESCEQDSSKHDKFGSETLTERLPESKVTKAIQRRELGRSDKFPSARLELVSGIDFKRFQKFAFSVAIRADLFARTQNRRLMPPSHFSTIRDSYRSEGFLSDKMYPIIISRSEENDEYGSICFPPYKSRIENHNTIEFRGARHTISIVVSNHEKSPLILLSRVLSNGEAPVIRDHFANTGQFRGALSSLTSIARKHPLRK